MGDYFEEISDVMKVNIAANFLMQAPPGEFTHVFQNVRILLSDPNLEEEASHTSAQYNMDRFIRAKIEAYEDQVLITKHGDLGSGRFLDPRNWISFSFDHQWRAASDPQPHQGEAALRPWRDACDSALRDYIKNHYSNGVCTVYGKTIGGQPTVIACIEAHWFDPTNCLNGHQCSEWKFSISQGEVELLGVLRVQVHCFEDGNVQLVSSKAMTSSLIVSDESTTAKLLVKTIEREEFQYQMAFNHNFQTVFPTTCKALRRQLPITHTKIDWDKLLSDNLDKEMTNP